MKRNIGNPSGFCPFPPWIHCGNTTKLAAAELQTDAIGANSAADGASDVLGQPTGLVRVDEFLPDGFWYPQSGMPGRRSIHRRSLRLAYRRHRDYRVRVRV